MKFKNQVELLYHLLRHGKKIDRVNAWNRYGIADLRSRVADCSRIYCITIDRERVPTKRYLRYFKKK